MGNVHDKEFPDENFRRVTALMCHTLKDSFLKCAKCWAKKLCSPCYGDTFFKGGTLTAPSDRICVIIRSITRVILLKIAEFVTDDQKWKIFAKNVNQMHTCVENDCKGKKNAEVSIFGDISR